MIRTRLALLFSIFALTGATACEMVDNSGGDPPPGDELSFRVLDEGGEPGDFADGAFLADPADLVASSPCDTGEELPNQFCTDAAAELEDGERLAIVRIQLGGCLGTGLGVVGMYLEDTTLHAHVIKSDASYGQPDVACTADIGATNIAVAVTGADDADAIDAHVGVFNPDLPGAPAVADQDLPLEE